MAGHIEDAKRGQAMRKPLLLAFLALLLPVSALLLAGCGSSRLPPINLDPLDVSAYVSRPCTLLTPQRATRRHLVPPGTSVTTGGGTDVPACHWDSATATFPPITAAATTAGGLAGLNRHAFTYFQNSGPVDGYPSVLTSTAPGGPHAGHCTVRVGVAPDSQVEVSADYPAVSSANRFSSDPCADADTLAVEMVGALAAGSP
jgi:hypothetical protein